MQQSRMNTCQAVKIENYVEDAPVCIPNYIVF